MTPDVNSDAAQLLTDVHQHAICGIDDGAKDWNESVAMLQDSIRNGIRDVICTSHVHGTCTSERRETYLKHYNSLCAYIAENRLPLRLHTGSEIFYSEESLELIKSGIAFPLADSDCVLLEFVPVEPFDTLLRAAHEFYNEGFTPVFAHIERYECLQDLDRLVRLREECGLKTQMNANTVLSSKGLFGSARVKKLLKKGLIDYIGSDSHDTSSRRNRMREAYELLHKAYGKELAVRLCRSNAETLFKFEPMDHAKG